MIRRDLLYALFGIGTGQAILLAATPLLAKMYGPAAFGTFSVIVAVAGIVATVAALRVELAMSGATDSDVAALTRASIVLPFLVVPLAMMFLMVTVGSAWAEMLPFDRGDLPIIGLIALLQGLVLVGSALSTRLGAFPTLAAIKICQPLIFVIVALAVVNDLSLAMMIGWVAALFLAIRSMKRVSLSEGWDDSWAAFCRMWRFPAISAPMALLDVLALALPLLVIASAFGDQAAGNFAQVQRLIGAPLVLVAAAGSQAFLKHAGDNIRSGSLVMPLLRRFVATMALLAACVVVVVAACGEPMLKLLLGPTWRTDTPFLILALLPVAWRVIASPVSPVLILTDRITLLGTWQLVYFLVTTVTLIVGSWFLSFQHLLVAVAISEFLMYGAYLALSVHAARQADRFCVAAPARV